MLVLARRKSETIVFGDTLFVTVVETLPGAVELAVHDSLVGSHFTVIVKEGEFAEVGPEIRVTYRGLGSINQSPRLGIEAPRWMPIFRKETWDAIRRR